MRIKMDTLTCRRFEPSGPRSANQRFYLAPLGEIPALKAAGPQGPGALMQTKLA